MRQAAVGCAHHLPLDSRAEQRAENLQPHPCRAAGRGTSAPQPPRLLGRSPQDHGAALGVELEAPTSTAVPGGEETCCFYLLSFFFFFFFPFRSSSDCWDAFRIPNNASGPYALQKTTLVSWHPASPHLLCGLFKAEELLPPCSGEGLRAVGTRALTVGSGRVSVPLGSSQEHRQGRVGHVVALGRAPSTQLQLLLPCSTATTRPVPPPLLSGGFLPSFYFFFFCFSNRAAMERFVSP